MKANGQQALVPGNLNECSSSSFFFPHSEDPRTARARKTKGRSQTQMRNARSVCLCWRMEKTSGKRPLLQCFMVALVKWRAKYSRGGDHEHGGVETVC